MISPDSNVQKLHFLNILAYFLFPDFIIDIHSDKLHHFLNATHFAKETTNIGSEFFSIRTVRSICIWWPTRMFLRRIFPASTCLVLPPLHETCPGFSGFMAPESGDIRILRKKISDFPPSHRRSRTCNTIFLPLSFPSAFETARKNQHDNLWMTACFFLRVLRLSTSKNGANEKNFRR